MNMSILLKALYKSAFLLYYKFSGGVFYEKETLFYAVLFQ